MIAIRTESRAIERGEHKVEQSALRNAPHTADELLAETWDRPYPRRQGAFPAPGMEASKYWPPVSRIDNVYGDRNLVCTCPRSEEHTSELQSLMRISYAVFCLKKKNTTKETERTQQYKTR